MWHLLPLLATRATGRGECDVAPLYDFIFVAILCFVLLTAFSNLSSGVIRLWSLARISLEGSLTSNWHPVTEEVEVLRSRLPRELTVLQKNFSMLCVEANMWASTLFFGEEVESDGPAFSCLQPIESAVSQLVMEELSALKDVFPEDPAQWTSTPALRTVLTSIQNRLRDWQPVLLALDAALMEVQLRFRELFIEFQTEVRRNPSVSLMRSQVRQALEQALHTLLTPFWEQVQNSSTREIQRIFDVSTTLASFSDGLFSPTSSEYSAGSTDAGRGDRVGSGVPKEEDEEEEV